MTVDNNLLQDLQTRGLIAQTTADEALQQHLTAACRTLYCGFDPTAASLHIGSLVPLLTLRRFQLAGHKPLALVGGATGLIGDPSFKAEERSLNTPQQVANWVASIERQIGQFLDFNGACAARVVNNLDWVGKLDTLTFLRDIGKHFAVNAMIHKESVKQRLDREGEGISFTEFSYSILQALDFAELYRTQQCTLQIGGSDQWGNITAGIDLTRRLHRQQVFGLTLPLITRADGAKFGKTEQGTIWLDATKTSPYAFYQFWLQTLDADVYRFLRYFTFLSTTEIDELERNDVASGRPQAQRILAEQVTALVHGREQLQAAQRITNALFKDALHDLSASDFQQLQLDGLPATQLSRHQLANTTLTQLVSECGLAKSGKQVKDALTRGGLMLNGIALTTEDNTAASDCFAVERALFGKYYLLKLGKRRYYLIEANEERQ